MRVKFCLNGIEKQKGWGEHAFVYNLTFYVVGGDSEENKSFFASTPSGEIKIRTVNESVANSLQPGQNYYVDFTPADQPEALNATLSPA